MTCPICRTHGTDGGYCGVCAKLYQRGRKRRNDRINEFNRNLARDPDILEAAVASGVLTVERFGYDKNHNYKLLPQPRIVWAAPVRSYITDEEIAEAHEDCCKDL